MYIFCDWQKFRRRSGACAFFLQFQGSSQLYFPRDSSLIAFNDSVVFERSLIWEINPTPSHPHVEPYHPPSGPENRVQMRCNLIPMTYPQLLGSAWRRPLPTKFKNQGRGRSYERASKRWDVLPFSCHYEWWITNLSISNEEKFFAGHI